MSTEIIAVTANLALTLSLIVAVIFGIAQQRTARMDRRERLTLETLRTYQTRDFAEMILFTTNTRFPENYEEFLSWPNEGKARFIQLMQEMESLGLLLADGLIDIDLVDKTLGSYVSLTWDKFSPVVLDMRVRLSDPYLAEYFQGAAEQIARRLANNPRKPFYETMKMVG